MEDNSADNSSDNDGISPLDTHHLRIIGTVVGVAMLLIIIVAAAGVIASVRP